MKNCIQIIAPSSPPSDAQTVLENGIKLLTQKGFSFKVSENLVMPYLFYANTLDYRVQDCIQALNDPEVDIILALRGGSGAGDVVCELLKRKSEIHITRPKIIIGFSDITAVHVFASQVLNIASIHANNLASIVEYPDTLDPIIEVARGGENSFALCAMNNLAGLLNAINAKLIGGNLTVLQCLIGTPMQPDFDNKIVILEDVGEPGYKIDRALAQFMRANLFAKVEAIIFGDFTQSLDYDQSINAFAASFDKPVFRVDHIGHDQSKNQPIILGANALIDDLKLSIISPFN